MGGDAESLTRLWSVPSGPLESGQTEQVVFLESQDAVPGTRGAGGLAAYTTAALGRMGYKFWKGYKFPLQQTHSSVSIRNGPYSRTDHQRLCYQWSGVAQSLQLLKMET